MIEIFAYLNSKPRIKPLLWNLISYPLEKIKLKIFNNLPENNHLIIKDLKLFQSMIKWDLLNYCKDGKIPKINLFLPANCIPYKDSINKLIIKNSNSYPKCLRPSALFAYYSNEYSNYFNEEILAEKDIDERLIYFQSNESNEFFKIDQSIFIVPEEPFIKDFTYELIETNEINTSIPPKSE